VLTPGVGGTLVELQLMLAGSGAYSLDNVLLKRNPSLADRPWFRWLASRQPAVAAR
jgi:hypothetical protein